MRDYFGAPGDASFGLNIDAAWRQLDTQDTIASKLRLIECFGTPCRLIKCLMGYVWLGLNRIITHVHFFQVLAN